MTELRCDLIPKSVEALDALCEATGLSRDDVVNRALQHRGGVWWHEAPIPPADHECWVQTSGWLNSMRVERCACGGTRLNQRGDWFDRNTRGAAGAWPRFARMSDLVDDRSGPDYRRTFLAAADPPGTCRWRNPRDSGPWIKVAENRWVHVGGGGGQTDEDVAAWSVGPLRRPTAAELSDRLRDAAAAADAHARRGMAAYFVQLAEVTALQPPEVAEAIAWALLGGRDA